MAASITVEEEHATYSRSPHPHNGYYAGDFSQRPVDRPVARPRAQSLPRN